MGAAIAASAAAAGNEVAWVSQDRSPATARRAEALGLEDLGTIDAAASVATHLVSVCPPAAALATAAAVRAAGFRGVYVDANAVAPTTALEVARTVEAGGATFVDGGIIGGPNRPRLYLAGEAARDVATRFAAPAEVIALDAAVPAASALKMVYAAWTKGTTAMLFAIAGAARALGVEGALRDEWSHSQPGLGDRLELSAGAARKAWRWSPEMEEIARTLADAGVPDGFHLAASEVFERLASFKDEPDASLDEVLAALLGHH